MVVAKLRRQANVCLYSLRRRCILNGKNFNEYTGWGETKVREILKRPTSKFTVILGNRLYVNKKKFDDYLEQCAKYNIPI